MNLVQHLKNRHVDLALHRPYLDEEEFTASFLLWNPSGQLCGFQQYRPLADKMLKNSPREGRYFTYRNKTTVSVFGVESLHLTPGIVFVTEGIFDAVRLTQKGCSAVAVLSNDPTSDIKNWLASLDRKVVAICDNDAAGRKLARIGHHAVFTEAKDLGDSSDGFVSRLVAKFVV